MAGSDELLALYQAHRESQQKYTYFMLAAAGAAVGFAVQKTEGVGPSWDLLFVGAAALGWCLSFYCGCKNLIWSQTALYANFNLLQLRQGVHPEQPQGPHRAAALSGVEAALAHNVARTELYARWQFRLFIGGAALFVAWRVIEIVRAGQPLGVTG